MDGQVALVERAGVGVGFAAEGAFLRRAVVERGVERRADAGGVVGRAVEPDVQPMIAVGRGVADEDPFGKWPGTGPILFGAIRS